MARNKSHGYLIVQDSYISFGKDDWVAYLVLIGDLWKVRLPCGTVFGGSWEVRPSIGERENLLDARGTWRWKGTEINGTLSWEEILKYKDKEIQKIPGSVPHIGKRRE